MIDYPAILSRKYPGSEWTLNGDDYDGLEWHSSTPKPSKETLDNLWATVQSEISAEEAAKAATRDAVLARLGITKDELRELLAGL